MLMTKNLKEFNEWIESMSYEEFMKWAIEPSENRPGRNNILPEIVDYLKIHPEHFRKAIETKSGPWDVPSPRSWLGLSETLIDQCLENTFGKRFDRISDIPYEELLSHISGIILDEDIAKSFSQFVSMDKS